MELRKVNPTDRFDEIGALYVESWRAAYHEIVPQDYLRQLNAEHWSSILAGNQFETYVVLEDGRYIGTTSICPARDPRMEGWGEVVSLYLLPDYTGKGYGSALLNEGLAALESRGLFDIYLWVLESNMNARRFYEMNGFSESQEKLPIVIGGKRLIEVKYTLHLEQEYLL